MGIPTLIATLTDASSTASLADTSSMTSTYDEYMFVCTNMHPASDAVDFQFQVNVASASGYNELITSTHIRVYAHESDDPDGILDYHESGDQAQGTAYQTISLDVGNDADQSCSGILHLFSPASTTYVTHFYSRFQVYNDSDYSQENLMAGYINATAAVTDISFKFESGDIDAGVIQIYGIA